MIFSAYHHSFLNKSGLTNRDFEPLLSIIRFSDSTLAKKNTSQVNYKKKVACHLTSHRHLLCDNNRPAISIKVCLGFSACALISFDYSYDIPTATESKQGNNVCVCVLPPQH